MRKLAGKSGAWLCSPVIKAFSSESEDFLIPDYFCLGPDWVNAKVSSLSPNCSSLPEL